MHAAISMRKDSHGCYRVAWRDAPDLDPTYVASFEEAVQVARQMEASWDATVIALSKVTP